MDLSHQQPKIFNLFKLGFAGKTLMAGAVAGAISRTLTAPLERLKIFYQVQDFVSKGDAPKYKGIWHGLKTMTKEEGVQGYFKGNMVNCIKVVPTSSIRFFSFETFKKHLMPKGHQFLPTPLKLLCGALSGITAVTATYPLDLVRTRLTLQTKSGAEAKYQGLFDCVGKIIKEEGFSGLYKGAGTAVASVAPFSAINFTSYEMTKEFVERFITKNPSIFFTALYGAFSGCISMSIMYPLDLIKRRLMVQGANGTEHVYKNGLDCFMKIIQNEGFSALYKGIGASYLKVIPTVSITFFTYEVMRKKLGVKRKTKFSVG